MKKIAIIATMLMVLLSGCVDKPSKIEKVSPCACYDFIQAG